MKIKKIFNYVSKVYGIIITSFLLLAFGSKIIGLIIEEGFKYLIEIPKVFVNWYDDPTGFFFTYIIGYAIIWWKPLWGSVIIMFGSTLFFIVNSDNGGALIFAISTFLVALFYLLYWNVARKNNIKDAQ
jgi:hypothetical protein